MQKIIIIGQSCLTISFPQGAVLPCQPVATPAGPLLNSAAMLASSGHTVSFISEAARDFLGTLLVNFLKSKNVNTDCIDLFADGGVTAVDFTTPGEATVPMRIYPGNQPFNATWPRIDSGDIVVFGGFFALNQRSRPQVVEIVNYARSRGALTIYLPGFDPHTEPRITRIMPSLLDNLELSDIILASTVQLNHLFNIAEPKQCFDRHIKFYCNTMVAADFSNNLLTALHGSDMATESMAEVIDGTPYPPMAGILTSLVEFLVKGAFAAASLPSIDFDILNQLAAETAKTRIV